MPLSSEIGICTRCRVTEFAFEANHSVFAYGGEIKELIARYKFSGRMRLSSLFAAYLASSVREKFPDTVIVPVPPRPHGEKPDHVERIAKRLEAAHGFTVARPLQRVGGFSQKTLDFEERKRNLLGMVRFRPGFAAPERAVLLDDVFTTGATADACARALRDAGCGKVFVATLAIDM
jgi:ComF family protein